MNPNLKQEFDFLSKEDKIYEFIDNNENTQEILNFLLPQLTKHFPKSTFSLEICNKLEWTTEEKLLVNISVDEEMFFNGLIDHFNEIYSKIDYLIEDIFCPVVLFPDLGNEIYDRMNYNSVINLVARTAYFNSDFDKNMQSEMTLREIPKTQQIKEIVEYCKMHHNPDISDIVYDLRLDLFDVDDIIDEMESNGYELNVRY